jgi:CheY-like chemotaxis protein
MGKKSKILIVEDNANCRQILALYLQHLGHLVIEAEDSAQAIAFATAERPDLILMDLGLPDNTGIETAAILHRNSNTAHIPIIALTGWASDKRKQQALNVGIKAYLVKPASFETLKKAIGDLVA